MRKLAMLGIFVLCAAAVGVLCVEGPGEQERQGASTVPSIDVAKPQTWFKEVAEAQKILDDMSDALILVASDEKRIVTDRTLAILLLGKIGNRKALHFLAANVSMHIEPLMVWDSGSEWPCRKALAEFGSPAGKAILKAIAAAESEDDLKHLAYALARVYGRPRAAVIVLGEQDWVPTERGRKNMEAVKKLLEKPKQ